MRIAAVVADINLREALQADICACGHETIFCDDIVAAATATDMIFLEWREGAYVSALLHGLEMVASQQNPVPVVVLVPAGGVTAMHRARGAGATDVLFCPPDRDEIRAEIEELDESAQRASAASEIMRIREILRESLVGKSEAFRKCLNELRLAAKCDANVLLMGETGTGKEMFARGIHQLSRRSGNKYLPINCAGVPETLVENELFGSVKGAYTGATTDHRGRFGSVGAGTLLLDEVGSISLALQAKLLRVLEQRVFQQLGSNEDIPFHGRLICATSVDLDVATEKGQFRRDLLGRIDQFRILLPPLRERRADIPILTQHFLRRHVRGRNIEISRSVMDLLDVYEFPGNIRQLENLVISALAHVDAGSVILPRHLPREIVAPNTNACDAQSYTIRVPNDLDYKGATSYACRQIDALYLPRLLSKHRGSHSRAAAEAGIDRKTFTARIREILGEEGA